MTDDSLDVVDRWDGGIGWQLADDRMERTSHALVVEREGTEGDERTGGDEQADELWLCDPLDAPRLDDRLAELGEVAGVVVQLDRHQRDAAAIARRHDVAVHLPVALTGVAPDLDCETRTFGGELDETGFHAITVVDNPFWREAALFSPDRGTLVVPEAVGTGQFFRAAGERLGVHLVLRAFPPRRQLGGVHPDRVLVGHGPGVMEDADTALHQALRNARRTAPGVMWSLLSQRFAGR